MFVSTKGIVIHKTKYSDTSIIVKVFTEKAGTQSFIIKNAFSKKSRLTNAQFGPLSLIELNYDNRKRNQLQFLKDCSVYYHYTIIPFDMVRNSIFIFYNELIYKLLYESAEDSILYRFLENSLLELDRIENSLPDIHLKFMLDISRILGFCPDNNFTEATPYFSIEDSNFTSYFLENQNFLSQEASGYLNRLLQNNHCESVTLPAKTVRNELLAGLIRYFELHNEHISQIESARIFSDLTIKKEN